MSNRSTVTNAETPGVQGLTLHTSSETERSTGRRTVVSKPGAVVEVSEYDLPDHIREAVARNLGIGTGEPRPAG